MEMREFDSGMNRLCDVFGDKAYPDERKKIIWREVKDLSGKWFNQTIDKLIGDSRYAPLMTEFREEISRERERLWQLEKRQHAEDAKNFFDCKFDNTEKSTICKTIIARMQGKVSDADYAKFVEVLESASKPTLVRGQSG